MGSRQSEGVRVMGGGGCLLRRLLSQITFLTARGAALTFVLHELILPVLRHLDAGAQGRGNTREMCAERRCSGDVERACREC